MTPIRVRTPDSSTEAWMSIEIACLQALARARLLAASCEVVRLDLNVCAGLHVLMLYGVSQPTA